MVGAASCSFSFSFVLPCCVAVNPVFQKSRCAVHFLIAILFCRCSLLFLDHTFVCSSLKPWLVQNQDWFAVFLVSCWFFHPSLCFWGFPLSQRFFPRSSFQLHVGRAAGNVILGAFCSFRCVASCQIVVWGGLWTLDSYFEVLAKRFPSFEVRCQK